MKTWLLYVSLSTFLLLAFLGLGGGVAHAQDPTQTEETPIELQLSPVSTLLQRPTLNSTGLPPVIRQTPRQVTATLTPSLTVTSRPTVTNTTSATSTSSPSSTAVPSLTTTASPTSTLTASSTPTATLDPSQTATLTFTPSKTPTHTPTETATSTFTATITATLTVTVTPSLTATPTDTPIPINVSNVTPSEPAEAKTLDPIIPISLVIFLLITGYVVIYALNNAAQDRYSEGFVMTGCPICQTGRLHLEERPYRSLGIPRVRRTVRCNACRSVLREVGRRRWRYAVDPHANSALFEQYNSRDMTEAELLNLAHQTDIGDHVARYVEDET